jgi:hypothetical protein
MKVRLLLILCFTCLFVAEIFAQKYTRNKQYTSIGGSLNAVNYFGDITPSSSFSSADLGFTRPNLSLHIMHRYTPRLSVRASMSWGRLQGDDFKSASLTNNDAKFRYARNAHFRNDIKELAVVGMIDFFENRSTFLRRPDFVPYAFAGIAVFHNNPKAKVPVDEGNRWVALQPLGTEGQGLEGYGKPYSRIQLGIPMGVGFRYKVSPRVDLAFEIGYRFTFTDYLDDVSGNYPAPGTLSGLAQKMSDRTQEQIAAYAGAPRDFERMATFTQPVDWDRDGIIDSFLGYGSDDPEGIRGGQRGKPTEKDWYLVSGFHINYILMRGVRCPKFR